MLLFRNLGQEKQEKQKKAQQIPNRHGFGRPSLRGKIKKASPVCKSLCSDREMRIPASKGSKKLKVSPYDCAHRGDILWKGKRIPASKLKGAYKMGVGF